jgi:4-hydroxybenzoate polyprenyltransferase
VPNASPAARRGAGRQLAAALVAASHPEPAALVTALTSLLALAMGRGWGTLLLGAAVAAGQLCVGWTNDYLDRDLDRAAGRADKPLAARAEAPGTAAQLRPVIVRHAAVVAGAACVALSLAVSLGFAIAHLAAVASAMAYNAGPMAYNAGLKALPASVVPYALAFGLLPVAVTLGLPQPRLPPTWAVAASALIGAGGHFTQALPDIPVDRRLGIRGLPQLLGQTASGVAAATLLLTGTLVVLLAPGRPGLAQFAAAAAATALAAGIVAATLADRARLAFRLTLAAAAGAVVAFLAGGSRL